MDLATPCHKCQHSYYDHAGRFTEEERARLMKSRSIGCWIVGCRCESFEIEINHFDPSGYYDE